MATMRNYSVQNRKLLDFGAACARSTEEVEVETNNKTKLNETFAECLSVCVLAAPCVRLISLISIRSR